jgi:hypothetical protein
LKRFRSSKNSEGIEKSIVFFSYKEFRSDGSGSTKGYVFQKSSRRIFNAAQGAENSRVLPQILS